MDKADALYAPVTESEDGSVSVELADNHPGRNDSEYVRRRGEIAAAAVRWQPGQPTPTIDYTEKEHGVWRTVCDELRPLHDKYGCEAFLEAKQRLGLPEDRIPQLAEVTALLEPLTGWRYESAPGLVPLREFYKELSLGIFHSTQYIRHHSAPLYTPEPDVVHEVIGHATALADPLFAKLTKAAGAALTRQETDESAKFVADVFWFSMEFGVMQQGADVMAYGAGILSSFGEMEAFRNQEIRPLNIGQMGTLEYDITEYQPIIFKADSMAQLEDVVGGFFEEASDELTEKYRAEVAA